MRPPKVQSSPRVWFCLPGSVRKTFPRGCVPPACFPASFCCRFYGVAPKGIASVMIECRWTKSPDRTSWRGLVSSPDREPGAWKGNTEGRNNRRFAAGHGREVARVVVQKLPPTTTRIRELRRVRTEPRWHARGPYPRPSQTSSPALSYPLGLRGAILAYIRTVSAQTTGPRSQRRVPRATRTP